MAENSKALYRSQPFLPQEEKVQELSVDRKQITFGCAQDWPDALNECVARAICSTTWGSEADAAVEAVLTFLGGIELPEKALQDGCTWTQYPQGAFHAISRAILASYREAR
jgi:hypothetical protein